MDTKKIYADQLLRAALNWCQPDVPGRLRHAFEQGADPNDLGALHPGKLTPLVQAIKKHDPDAVAVLLSFGANPLAPIDYTVGTGISPTMTALWLAQGTARDGKKYGFQWADKAFEVERLVAEAAAAMPACYEDEMTLSHATKEAIKKWLAATAMTKSAD